MNTVSKVVRKQLNRGINGLQERLNSDVVFYSGSISDDMVPTFRQFIEIYTTPRRESKTLSIILNTTGGSVEAVERMVAIVRHHYDYVYFVVPDYAMSAGTILCMSGDKIFMDYSSSLGPIDPQVFNGTSWSQL